MQQSKRESELCAIDIQSPSAHSKGFLSVTAHDSLRRFFVFNGKNNSFDSTAYVSKTFITL